VVGRHAAPRRSRARAGVVIIVVVVLAGVGVAVMRSQVATSTTTTTSAAPTTTTTVPVAGPAPVCVAQPGGGAHCSAWATRDTWARDGAVRTAQFAYDPRQPSLHAYAAWLRSSAVLLALYPGYKGPGPTNLARGPQMVPVAARPRLLATFNSGFYEADGAAGFYVNHLLYHPMIRGLATVVRYRNGTLDVVAWTGGATPPADVLMARQNLTLLVSNGVPTARAATNSLWGITLNGVPAVWRTALGVTAAGDLVYAAAPAQTSASMAHIMVLLHCVRAMQLDINPEWPIFVTYAGPGAAGPSLFVPNPNQIPGRFLYSSTKDFFAVYVAHAPGEAQPW